VWAPTVGGTKRRAGFALPWAAVSWAGRLGPRRRKEPGGPAGALGQREGNRPSGPEARQREGEGFTFSFFPNF